MIVIGWMIPAVQKFYLVWLIGYLEVSPSWEFVPFHLCMFVQHFASLSPPPTQIFQLDSSQQNAFLLWRNHDILINMQVAKLP